MSEVSNRSPEVAVLPLPPTAEAAYAAVQQLLKDGSSEEAIALTERALDRWPKNLRLLLGKGDVLAKAASRGAAAKHYSELIANGLGEPWAAGRLTTLLAAGPLSFDDAMQVGEAIAAATIDPKLKQALLQQLVLRDDPGERFQLLQAVAPRAEVFALEWRLAVMLTEQGEIDAALQLLESAAAAGRNSPQAALLYADLLAVCDRLVEAVAVLERQCDAHPDSADVYRRLTALWQRLGDFERAADVFEAALEHWPQDWMLLLRLNRLPVRRERLQKMFARIAANAEAVLSRDDRFRLQYALASLHLGQIEPALDLLRRPFEGPVATMAAPVLKALGARPPEWWLAHSRLTDDRTRDVQVTRAPDARATVVLPTGVSFGNLPLAFVDSLLAAHGVNVVYLRDFRKRAYLRGIASLAPDEAGTIAALQQLLAELGASRTLVIGSSSGGFTALRYGALLGADAAVSFSGPTELVSFHQSTRHSVWNPNFFILQLLKRERDLPQDLVPVLSQPRVSRFQQFYGADSESDAKQALRLAGLPGVELMPVTGVSDHFVVDHMIGSGEFDRLLKSLIEGA